MAMQVSMRVTSRRSVEEYDVSGVRPLFGQGTA
jgi:hypothetical protein